MSYQCRIFRPKSWVTINRLVTFVHSVLRQRSHRLRGALAQLNDVLAVYAVGLALLDLVVYWRSCQPLL